MTKHKTREGWLNDAIKALEKTYFKPKSRPLPAKLQVSCGFPFGHATAVGQCFDPRASKDGTTQIFICPTQDEPVKVLAILLHEMGHCSVGIEHGHKGPFRQFCKEVGFEGKFTATVAKEGTPLHAQLTLAANRLGAYPHMAMQKVKKKGKGGSGWLRMRSVEHEDYTIVISPKALEKHGAPLDPWGDAMELVE